MNFRYLLLLFFFHPFLSLSQDCYQFNIKFDPIIFSFCDDDENCLNFDIYADDELYMSIDLDTTTTQVYSLCLDYNNNCIFSGQFSGIYNGFGSELFYFQVFNDNDENESYNLGDVWQSESFCGCTDISASNYNENAIIDDGSCVVFGCTNPQAENYNQNATIDDESCIVLGCTDPSAFNFSFDAHFDDGSCVPVIEGCTDISAFNYNESANTDDGSCSYCSIEVSLTPFFPTSNSNCDGFIGVSINSSNYQILWSNGSETLNQSQLCNDIYSYTITDDDNCYAEGKVILTNYSGCTDPTAYNFDNTAIIDDGSCIETIFGCTDSSNINYNPIANFDDGSCDQCDLTIQNLTVQQNISNQCDGSAFVFATSPGLTDFTYLWSNGSTSQFTTSLCTGQYTVTVFDENGCTEDTSFTVGNVVFGCTNDNALNFDSLSTVDDGTCIEKIEGCMDPTANNYDELANYSLGCTYDIYGCTDSLATNFNIDANINLGNCVYPCSDNEIIIVMYDNLGNGWGSGFYRIKNSLGTTVSVGTLASGAYSQDTLCLPSDCYSFDVMGAGIGSIEILWEIVYDNVTILTGTGQSGYSFTIGECAVFGCTDQNAYNFNQLATSDDGSCQSVELGCIDQLASNFNSTANTDDGTCIYDILGCTDPSAGNYNPEANMDDGSCHSPIFACDITPSGLFVDNIIHNRVVFNWSAPEQAPSYYMIRYRPVGAAQWTVMRAGPETPNAFTGTSRTRYFHEAATTYEWSMRARMVDENLATICQSPWSASAEYTTLPACANLENLAVDNVEANWVTFLADAPDASWGVWQSKGKMREVGTNAYRYVNGGSDGTIAGVLKGNFTASTDYEWHTKAWCTGNVDENGNPDPMYHSGWGDFSTFTTQAPCDKFPTNLTTSSNGANTAVTMSWDTPQSGAPDHYFLEMTNLTTGAVYEWNYQDGESNSRTKFGQNPGDEIYWRIRGACGTNGTSWATIFTQPVTYTLGGARLASEVVSQLDVYPNPSRGKFNISFELGSKQDVYLNITNYLGEVIFTEELKDQKGDYDKTIDLVNKANGIYMLNITTNDQNINQKIVIQ